MKWFNCLLDLVLCLGAAWPATTIAAQERRPSPTSATGPGGIAGTVINSVTRRPLGGVHIMLLGYGSEVQPSTVYGAMSDADGHFSIQALPPTAYVVVAERHGFIKVPGKSDATSKGAVQLKPGEHLQNVTLEMAPRPVIAGRVLDEYGDPVMGVAVSALPLSPQGVPAFSGQAETDDHGEFRLVVTPGKYYLKAHLWTATSGVSEVRSDGTVESDYLVTFYPSATTTDAATPLEARAGRELNGVEIHLARTPVLSISGTVAGIPDTALWAGLTMAWGPSASEIRSSRTQGWSASTRAALTDTFRLSHLEPGFYRIYARSASGGQELQSQVMEVSLTDASVEDLRLTLAPGSDVTGKVEWTEPSPSPAAQAGQRTVRLQQLGGLSYGSSPTVEVAADGAFAIKNVFADRYRMVIEPLPENGFIKTVRLNGTPVPDGILDFSNGADGAQLKITLSANGGQISGRVEADKQSTPALFNNVVLFPDRPDVPARDQLRFSELVEDGGYSFHGLPPGKYRLLAYPSEFGEFREVLKRYGSRAELVEIKEGDNISRNLKIAGEEGPDETHQ
jgi:Carboxypeptidase regulatory-like domain